MWSTPYGRHGDLHITGEEARAAFHLLVTEFYLSGVTWASAARFLTARPPSYIHLHILISFFAARCNEPAPCRWAVCACEARRLERGKELFVWKERRRCDSPLTPLITDEEDSVEFCCKFLMPQCWVCLMLSPLYYSPQHLGLTHAHTHTHTVKYTHTQKIEEERESENNKLLLSLPPIFSLEDVILLP